MLVETAAQAQVPPDAPRPQSAALNGSPPDFTRMPWDENPLAEMQASTAETAAQATRPMAHAPYEKRKWAQWVDPGERIPPLYADDKWIFWLHQEARVSTAFPALISAGYGQLTDTPRYGSDSEAFGDRLGAAVLRQASFRFFCSSLFPVIVHEDPRYFRKATGGYLSRARWAARRVLITQNDSGSHGFNFSNIVGHLAASALTPLYYPARSANVRVVMQTWGTSIAGSVGDNLFLEFGPDLLEKWRRHRERKDSSGNP
jgi:hypothetical protein